MKSRILSGLGLSVLLLTLILPHGVKAADFPIISTDELKAKLDSGAQMLVFFPLSDIEFNLGHIPGTTNIPLAEIKTTGKLPQDKDGLIITY